MTHYKPFLSIPRLFLIVMGHLIFVIPSSSNPPPDTLRIWAKSFSFFGSGYYETLGRLRKTGTHAYIYTHEDTSSIVSLALNPNDPDRVFSAIANPSIGSGDILFFLWTDDSGENWNSSDMILDEDEFPIRTLVSHPSSGSLLRLFAATSNGVYTSINQGVTWNPFNQDSLEGRDVRALAKSPYGISSTFTLYAGTDNEVWKRLSTPGQKWGKLIHTLADHDFDTDALGSDPSGWTILGTETPGLYIEVDSSLSISPPHSLLLYSDASGTDSVTALKTFADTTVVEWKFFLYTGLVDTAGRGGTYRLMGENSVKSAILLTHEGDSLKAIRMDTTISLMALPDTQWVHVRILARSSDHTFDIWVDGSSKGENLSFYDTTVIKLDGLSYTAHGDGLPYWVDEVFVNPYPLIPGPATFLAADPLNPNKFYLGTGSGMFTWSGQDTGWTSLNTGLTDLEIQNIAVDPTNGSRILVGTPSGVFLTSNGGANWASKSSGLSNTDVRAIAIDPINPTTLYAGTWGGGVFKSTNSGDSWSEMNIGFPIHRFAHFVSSIVVDPDSSNNLFVGTQRGVFKSTDGGISWTEKNFGLLKSYVKDGTLDSLLLAFENQIPSDPTKGIYETTVNLLGSPPDVDGDPKIFIYVLDIQDLQGDGTQGSYLGLFDPANEDSNHPNSNRREVLYVDAYPLDVTTSEAHQALTHQLALMVQWGKDPNEERWVTEGIANYSEFKHGYIDTTVKILFPSANSLTFWGDGTETAEKNITYLWTMYLYEKFGGDSTIKFLASEPKNGFEGVDSTLASQGFSDTNHIEVYSDWVVACYLDLPNPSYFGGRYGFDFLNVFGSKDFLQPGLTGDFPYLFIEDKGLDAWSTRFYFMYYLFIDTTAMKDTLLFNGENPNRFSVQILKLDTVWTDPPGEGSVVIPYSLNQWNEGRLYVGDFKNGTFPSLAIAVSVVSDSGTIPAPFFLDDEPFPPTFVKLGIFQNPNIDRFLDIYVFSERDLFEDVSIETPTVEVKSDTITRVEMEVFTRPGTDSISTIYHGEYEIVTSDTISIIVTGEDPGGNEIDTVQSKITVTRIVADRGGRVTAHDGQMSIEIPEKGLYRDTYVTVFVLESLPSEGDGLFLGGEKIRRSLGDLTPLGSSYQVGPNGLQLKKSALLTLEGDFHGNDPDELGIYRYNGEEWIYLGGLLDASGNKIYVEITSFGTFQVLLGPHPPESSLPKVYALSNNIPNPMGVESLIRYQLPKKSSVSLKIYNVMGQVVKTLVEGLEEAGYQSVPWRGEDDRGRRVASGVYFYTLTADDFKATKKLILLK